MSWISRFTAMFRKKDLDNEFQDELAAHVAMLTEENVRAGMSEAEARRAALVKIGGLESAMELHRDTRGVPLFESINQDLRYTLRTFRKDLGFTVFAILIVGLGIGASATIFSVVNTLLIRPLPFRAASELIWIANSFDGGLSGQTVQVDHLRNFQAENQSFSDVAGYMAFYGVGDSKLTSDSTEPERLSTVGVTQNFFPLLGVQPAIGRNFSLEEAKWNGPKAVLLSYGLWQRRFASDPNILGRKLVVNNEPVPVIGVLPESFDFGAVFAPGTRIDMFNAFPLSPETNRWGNTMAIVGRLKPGVALGSAKAELSLLSKRFTEAHRKDMNEFTGVAQPLADHVSGRLRPALLVLACAVGVVMLIVCANLSNLLLARMATRQKEVAIRAALGAGRRRLIQQMLTESVVLSCAGGLLGLVLAILGTKGLARLDSLSLPLLKSVHVDLTALAFTLGAAILTGLVFGLIPALHVPGITLHDSLKEGGRGSSESKGRNWVRKTLVISEVAFACVLLVGAGLLIRSFLRVMDVNLGFQPEHAATVRVDPDSKRYKKQEQQNAYFSEVLRLTHEIPGVSGAGLTDCLPLGRNRTWGAPAEGVQYKDGEFPLAFVRIVSDGYLQAMGIPFKEGRDFTPRDAPGSEPVIIINETLARRLWPGQNAIGKKMRADGPRRVVGVVGDVRHLALTEGAGNEMYLPMRQTQDWDSVDLVVRSTLPPAQLASAVRQALHPIEPNLAGKEFRPLQTLVDKSISPRRFVVLLLAGFAGFALILASLGIYAVISYSVSQRTQEIGIRMALGASPATLRRGIILQTLVLAGIGMLGGLAGSWALARTITSLLFEVKAGDPLTFVLMLLILTVVAVIAGYLPALRASRVDPITALRST